MTARICLKHFEVLNDELRCRKGCRDVTRWLVRQGTSIVGQGGYEDRAADLFVGILEQRAPDEPCPRGHLGAWKLINQHDKGGYERCVECMRLEALASAEKRRIATEKRWAKKAANSHQEATA